MLTKPAKKVITTYDGALLQVVAHRAIQNAVAEMLSQYNLVTTQWIILGTLSEHGRAWRFTDIAHMLKVESPLVTRLMDPLVTGGYINVTAPIEDKRIKLAAITEKGLALVGEIEDKLYGHLRLSFPISEKDLATYFSILQKLIEVSSDS